MPWLAFSLSLSLSLSLSPKHEVQKSNLFPQKAELAITLLPFAVFLVLKLVSEAILAPATGNTSDLAGVTLENFIKNAASYFNQACKWFGWIFDDALMNWADRLLSAMTKTGEDTYGVIALFHQRVTGILVIITLLLSLLGLILDGFKRELPLTLFAIAYAIVVCMLPYNQGVRYIYPILTLIPVYFGHACKRIAQLLRPIVASLHLARILRAAGVVCVVCACALTFASAVRGIEYARAHDEPIVPTGPQDFYSMYAYTPCALEVYSFIQANTPENAVIGFEKPRALFLNTGRVSICTNTNNHSLDEVDYFLTCAQVGEEQLKKEGNGRFAEILQNAEFTLYERIE